MRPPGPLIAACLFALVAGCGRADPSGPVRTPTQASEIAQRTLRSAHLDEEVVDAERWPRDGAPSNPGAWIVTTRRRETSMTGHLVTVDAASGDVSVERYRTVQLGP